MQPIEQRVSILIPTYNRERYIAETLASVLDQRREGDEIVVVDDGSTDGTAGVMETYVRRYGVRYIRKEHTNAPDNRNRAIKEARNPWILWLGDDDILMPGVMDNYRKLLRQYPDVDVMYGNLEIFGHLQNYGETRKVFADYYKKNETFLQLLFYSNRIPDSGSQVRKSVYERFGGFDTAFDRLHDYEYWTRTALKIQVKHCNRYVLRWRWHSGNMSSGSVKTNKKYNYMILEKLLKTYSLKDIFPFYKANNGAADIESSARADLEIGKQYAKASEYPPATEKAFRYLENSIRNKPTAAAYFEWLQLLNRQPENRKQELQAGLPASFLDKAHQEVKRITGRSYTNKYKIASLNKTMGDYREAETKFKRLAGLLEGKKQYFTLLAGVNFHLGEIHRQTGRPREAQDYFARTLELNPFHKEAALRLKPGHRNAREK